ncbi:tRNA-splicing endonuclease subunit Sen34 [Adelges cooleyi]|uniref:tRNA-splicing endonuclease subunit Sen34 n=1 Tax=Adelges cooleyi TaxID=133065 RepID=UPI0021804742|nr:tRNA-splicing endonuclease subunit Sen34 [Adelges cooleyi]
MDKTVNIQMINGKSFIWSSDDWYILRFKYHILGNLIGSLPLTPRQEHQNGLPCLLLPEETRLLIENGIGRLVQYPSLTCLPDENEIIHNKSQEDLDKYEIRKKYAEKKGEIISKLVQSAILADGGHNCKEVMELKREILKIKPYDASSQVLIHLNEPKLKALEIMLPEFTTDFEKLRYKVFKDLWTKGFYLTCGIKFGGDYLVYNGDPLAYHAQYIVCCGDVDKHNITSASRIGSVTNKKMVLAKHNETSIEYFILHFSNSKVVDKEVIHFEI